MTKTQIIELARRTISAQGSKENLYDERIVELWMALAYDQIISQAIQDDKISAEFLAKEYLNVAISLDSTRDIYYSTLPVQVIQFPLGECGIVNISTMQGRSMEFLPATANDLRYFHDIEAGTVIIDQIFYTPYFDRVDYSDNITSDIVSAGVRMLLIRSFDAISGTENITVPKGQPYDLINATINMMKNVTPLDLRNNNTDTWTQMRGSQSMR
jgi:hypothetical protein